MKNNIQLLWRSCLFRFKRIDIKNVIRPLVAFFAISTLILPIFVMPAFAVADHSLDLNYIDYISSYTINDDETVTVTLGGLPTSMSVYANGKYVTGSTKGSLKFSSTGAIYDIKVYYPFAGIWSRYGCLSLANLPANTYISSGYQLNASNNVQVNYLSITASANYVIGNDVKTERIQIDQTPNNVLSLQYLLSRGNDENSCLYIFTNVQTDIPACDSVDITLLDLTLKIKISALAWEAMQDQKSQKLLDDINNNLDEIKDGQKKYNEEILYGDNLDDHNVNGPGGFNDKVDQQGDQAQNGMEEINKIPKPDADTAIPDIVAQVPADGMTLLSNIMDTITGFSIVNVYLLIVVGLFIVSFIMYGKKES